MIMNQLSKRATVGSLLAASLMSFGCGSDDDFGIPVPPIGLQPPLAINDNYSVPGGSQLSIASGQGVLVNDTPNQGTIVQFQNPSARGGLVVLNQDGSFVYTPPAGQFNVSDTFTYSLDNGFGSSTATVTIQIGGQGFFVKNDAPAGGNGSVQFPFNTLAAAVSAAAGTPGAQIVVFRGNGTASGQSSAVTLQANQSIVAQDPANPPTISGPITLANNNTLSNLRLVGTTGGDAVIGTGVVNATLTNLVVDNTSANAFNFTNPTGTVAINNITASNIGRAVLPLRTASGSLTVVANNWTVTNTVGNVTEAELTGTAVVDANFDQMVFNDLGTGGFGTGFEWDTRNSSNATLRVSNYRFDTGLNGVFFTSHDTSNVALVLTNGNITNCGDRGFVATVLNASTLKTRSTGSRFVGNAQGYEASASSSGAARLCARLTGNTSDSYRFLQGLAAVVQVENLAQITTENVGTLVTAGVIQDVAIGSCGIP
jgi:hypothetical protein